MQTMNSNSSSQNYSQRTSHRKRNHPDRLKVNIWNVADDHVQNVRRTYCINKDIIMRSRGVGKFKRIEVWCSSRRNAEELYARIKNTQCNMIKKRHISIGTTYKERAMKNKKHKRKEGKGQLTCMHWNARSLMNKVEELKKEIDDTNARVICIQESGIPKDEKRHPRFKEFKIFNFTRPDRRGGGVTSLIHKSIVVKSHEQVVTANMEVIICDIILKQDIVIKVVNVYIFNQAVTPEELQSLLRSPKHLLIMGDFNAKHESWNDGAENRNGQLVYNWILSSNLILLNQNKGPTYQSPSSGSLSTLDLTLISPDMIELVNSWHIGSDLSSDHFPIFFNIDSGMECQSRNAITTRYKVKDANWPLFKIHTSNCTVNNIEEIENNLMTAASKSIPTRKANGWQKPSNVWWTDEISSLRRERQRARKAWKKSRTPQNRSNYNRASAKCKRAVKIAKRASWCDFVGGINSNTPCAAVWKRFKAIQGKPDPKIYQIEKTNGHTVTNAIDIAEVFNNMYIEKSGNEAIWPTHLKTRRYRYSVELNAAIAQKDECDFPFTKTEIMVGLQQLKSSTPGEDNVHNLMLQNCSEDLLDQILSNLNRIWVTGDIPLKWKQAVIIPLLKLGKPPEHASSYRPIALTSCLGKLFERLVNNRLIWRLEKNGNLSSAQFGFRPKRSTCDALLLFTESIYKGFSNKECTTAVLIDFEAAFDRVSRTSIIAKCMEIGLKGNLLNYIVHFLNNRTIKTKINDTYSKEGITLNGIPQGSVISPTLFNVALHDLENEIPKTTSVAVFADDVTIWATHSDPETATMYTQEALNSILRWSEKWGFTISSSKTEACFFSRRYLHKYYTPSLVVEDMRIPFNANPTLLGIKLDPKLLWKDHVNFAIEKCTNRLNALKAIASKEWGADTYILRQFYQSFVRSKLLYACEVWGGAAATHIKKLETFQNAALRICLGCPKTTSIQAMEVELSVEPLDLYIQSRRWKRYFQLQASRNINGLDETLETDARQSLFCHQNKPDGALKALKPERIPTVLEDPPWLRVHVKIIMEIPGSLTKSDLPALLRVASMDYIEEKYHDFTKIYTDGSVDVANMRSGAAYYCPETNESFLFPCDASSSMNAELLALSAALEFSKNLGSQNICILTDSKSSLQALSVQYSSDYHFRISEVNRQLKCLKAKNVVLQWIPSHCGIPGNEAADRLASEACSMSPVPERCYSLKQCKAEIDRLLSTTWKHKWQECDRGRQYYSIQDAPNNPRFFKGLARSVATFAARARLGHIVTNQYLHRFQLSDSPLCGACQLDIETLQHILLECPKKLTERETLREKMAGHLEIGKILKQSCLWPLAATVYRRHRAIETNSLGSPY